MARWPAVFCDARVCERFSDSSWNWYSGLRALSKLREYVSAEMMAVSWASVDVRRLWFQKPAMLTCESTAARG
jgi:hypothetical protein